jgi:YegS/Rv2252/BmrU family lipid kinase
MADSQKNLEDALAHPIQDLLTETPTLVPRIVRKALEDNIQTIVSVGGDGTHSQVLKGFFHENDLTQAVRPHANLVLMSRGTGGDLCRHLKLGKDLKFVVDSLRGKAIPFDIGLLDYFDEENTPKQTLFINITSLGLSGETALKIKNLKQASALSYLIKTLQCALQYRSKSCKIWLDEVLFYEGPITLLAIANGSYFGGGMHIAPQATVSDGLFDIVLLKELSKFKIFTKIAKVYSGKHLQLKEVLVRTGKTVRLESEDEVLLEIDGDPLGKGPIKARILPAALQLKLPLDYIPSTSTPL